jgi:hypothetical protein
MERFFRSLKIDWMPTYSYRSFLQAKHHIVNYLIGYYSQLEPHQHNGDMSPNMGENKVVFRILCHFDKLSKNEMTHDQTKLRYGSRLKTIT